MALETGCPQATRGLENICHSFYCRRNQQSYSSYSPRAIYLTVLEVKSLELVLVNSSEGPPGLSSADVK